MQTIEKEDALFFSFLDNFIEENPVIKGISAQAHYDDSYSWTRMNLDQVSRGLYMRFHFEGHPIRAKDRLEIFAQRSKTEPSTTPAIPQTQSSFLRRIFNRLGFIGTKTPVVKQLDPVSGATLRKQKFQELTKKLNAQVVSLNDPELSTQLDTIKLNFVGVAEPALNNPSVQSGFGLYLNVVENLTRTVDAFLQIPAPSSESVAKLISRFESMESETTSFQADIQRVIQSRAELEFDIRATVMRLRAPARN